MPTCDCVLPEFPCASKALLVQARKLLEVFGCCTGLLVNRCSDVENMSVLIVDPSSVPCFLTTPALHTSHPLGEKKTCVDSVKRTRTSLIIKKVVKVLLHEI